MTMLFTFIWLVLLALGLGLLALSIFTGVLHVVTWFIEKVNPK